MRDSDSEDWVITCSDGALGHVRPNFTSIHLWKKTRDVPSKSDAVDQRDMQPALSLALISVHFVLTETVKDEVGLGLHAWTLVSRVATIFCLVLLIVRLCP